MSGKAALSGAATADLIRERARLLSDIRKFEKEELPSDAWFNDPKPDEVYLENLEKLAALAHRMIELYRSEHA